LKLSDYLVQRLLEAQITEFFGYQGTMIAHFVDSICKNPQVRNHTCYNEQGAAFAACGYTLSTGKLSVAYATSGPGALNLVSGVANAYYDSLPVVFITGQINTYEYRPDIPQLRQAGFQETRTVDVMRPICKYAVQITDACEIGYEIEKAIYVATHGRKGPVVIDIPMNIQRTDIDPASLKKYEVKEAEHHSYGVEAVESIRFALASSKRPVLLLGNGMDRVSADVFVRFAQKLNIPVVTSLLGKRWISDEHPLNFGYLGGAYGHRYANMIVDAKCDQIIAFGISLGTRQTGTKVSAFAPEAKVLRFDIDPEELKRKIKNDEVSWLMDTKELAALLEQYESQWAEWASVSGEWLDFCNDYRAFVREHDLALDAFYPNQLINAFNRHICKGDVVVSDVGQHMMWVGQSIAAKDDLPILFSGGHGAMGFALPAAIGASIARPNATVFCFCGDGSFQMNIQELEWLKREKLNVVIVILNNSSLGLIVQQQEAYFEKNYFGSAQPDYTAPAFAEISKAYGIESYRADCIEQIDQILWDYKKTGPLMIEYVFSQYTKAYPKTKLGERIYDQEPSISEKQLIAFLER